MNALSFASPFWLWLLPLVVVLPFVAIVRWQGASLLRFRHSFVHRFVGQSQVEMTAKRNGTDWFVWFAGVLMVLALSQPIWQFSQGTESAVQQQADGVVVLESSVSMLLVESNGQSRLEAAQSWLTKLLAQRDASTRTGLVVFGDDAYQVLSATTDAPLLVTMIQRINPALAGRGDSALLEGLTLGVAELVKAKSSGWVLLVHDGAQSVLRGELKSLLDWAKQHSVRLAVISVGGLETSHHDTGGLLYSPRSDELMQQLALQGAVAASFDDEQALTSLRASLLQAQQQTTIRFVPGKTLDLTPFLLLLALLAWALPWFLKRSALS